MKLKKIIDGEITVTVSDDELLTISNAINEVCNALHLDDFQTRMGVSMAEALKLLNEISQIRKE